MPVPAHHLTVVIHVEKANGLVNGLYGAINQEFLLHAWPDVQFVNREEDTGDENSLRAQPWFLASGKVSTPTIYAAGTSAPRKAIVYGIICAEANRVSPWVRCSTTIQ